MVRRRLLVGLAMLASVSFFFRDALMLGLERLYGDGYDAVIEAAILEHWRGVLSGDTSWNTTLWFWPHPRTLGYNDTLIIPALASVPARLAGADPFVAAFASHVFMRALGFAGMYVLLRRGFETRLPLAIAGAAVFTTANVSLLQMYHPQLLSVGILPWLGFLLLRTVQSVARRHRRAVAGYGGALALLYGATALSSFYAAWFFALFVLLLAAVLCIASGGTRWRALVDGARQTWPGLLLVAGIAGAALIPLLVLYLPQLDAVPSRGWRDGPAVYLIDLQVLFNVGAGNLLWGWIAARFAGGEAQVGIPPVLLVIGLVALAWSLRERTRALPCLAIGVATAALILLTFRWPGDHPPWRLVWQVLPGAEAIRTVSRALLFAIVPLIVIAFVWLDRVARPAWATALIVLVLLAEQVQLRPPLGLDRDTAVRLLAEVGVPPPDCQVFFVVAARHGDWAAEARAIERAWGGDGEAVPNIWRYPHNVDAMLIASYHGRPTINGYSSFNPPGWDFADSKAPDYVARVRRYTRQHGLRRVCGLDTRRHPRWFRL